MSWDPLEINDRMTSIPRKAYSEMFGPTTGDRVRLADTDLWIRVEKDFTVYGDEVKFGGGKVIRDGMGQSQVGCEHSVDTVITNALIVDHWVLLRLTLVSSLDVYQLWVKQVILILNHPWT